MSGAPICIGISQFAKPTAPGISAPNTMMSPCSVVNELKNSGLTICNPGLNSSARIVIAIAPPMINIVNANHRYIVPMSLWLVVVIQRMIPLGWCACSSGACAPGAMVCGVLLIQVLPKTALPSMSLPRRLHFRRLHDVLIGLVAPAVAGVADDRGNVDVGQVLPGRHLAVVLAVQHDV